MKIDFGDKQFNREQLERELASRFNKIEVKRVDMPPNTTNSNFNSNQFQTQKTTNNLFNDDTLDFGDDPLKMMDFNLNNVSAIHAQPS